MPFPRHRSRSTMMFPHGNGCFRENQFFTREFCQYPVEFLRHGPGRLVSDIPGFVDDIDHVGETSVLPMNGLVHSVHEDGGSEIFLGNKFAGIAELLIEVLMLAVLPVRPFAGVGLSDVDLEELDIPIQVLLSKPLQGSDLLPEGRSGEGTKLQDNVFFSPVITQRDMLARHRL